MPPSGIRASGCRRDGLAEVNFKTRGDRELGRRRQSENLDTVGGVCHVTAAGDPVSDFNEAGMQRSPREVGVVADLHAGRIPFMKNVSGGR